ncbi:hypothetical protein ACFYVR_24355 [Rhodococcus sp. NPDC003318]
MNSRTLSSTHLLAPRDADDRVMRARFVLAMLAAVTVVMSAVLLFLAMP